VGIVAMNCIDAIFLGDAREVWVIDLEFEIKSYIDHYCLERGPNPNDEKLPL
jgi:hypothetical protein